MKIVSCIGDVFMLQLEEYCNNIYADCYPLPNELKIESLNLTLC